MTWVNGSIVETAVSTGGRSFNWGTTYGQSLVADILEDGASGVKGYVYEPYLSAVGSRPWSQPEPDVRRRSGSPNRQPSPDTHMGVCIYIYIHYI